MKEVPMIYVKANQAGIVTVILIAFVFQQPWLIFALWVIQTIGLLLGGQWNLFVRIAKLIVKPSSTGATQAAELQRFNNTLAVIFLTISIISFSLGSAIVGYVFAAFLFVAAFVALLGYCIGCTIYFQYKQWVAKRRLNRS